MRIDWLWFGGCERCDALPGKPCLDQRNRRTATIHGQNVLRRPHPEREKLTERLLPLLSSTARDAIPEICARLDVEAKNIKQIGNGIAGNYNEGLVNIYLSAIDQLKRLYSESRTNRDMPWIEE